MTITKKWKFLREGLKSDNGTNRDWTLKEWRSENAISICNRGFHCSKTPLQAFGYVHGEILARVEVKGTHIDEDDKQCWSDMRIIEAYQWRKEDSVALAIYAAELVIGIYEERYPNDLRPRSAIEAAKAYLAEPTEEKRAAADAACAAAGAADATDAACAASHAAYAAYAALRKKLELWMTERIKQLPPYEG